jgi:hypothetical protein
MDADTRTNGHRSCDGTDDTGVTRKRDTSTTRK